MTPAPASSQEVAPTRRTAVRLGRAIGNVAMSEVGARAAALAGVPVSRLFAINGRHVVNRHVGRSFTTAVEQGGLDRDCCDATLAIAADGTWIHTATTEERQ